MARPEGSLPGHPGQARDIGAAWAVSSTQIGFTDRARALGGAPRLFRNISTFAGITHGVGARARPQPIAGLDSQIPPALPAATDL